MTAPNDLADRVTRARDVILERAVNRPAIGLILGSGLGGLADRVEQAIRIPYADIPGFPKPSAAGHAGTLVSGHIAGASVIVLAGRSHLYEGWAPWQVAFPVWVLAAAGVRTLIATNASGGIAPDLGVGDVVVLHDHLNLPGLTGLNPLTGVVGLGERFVSMAGAYDALLAETAIRALRGAGLSARRGVYAMVGGPSYETPAEIRYLRNAGADVVGMSTVPEVIVARQQGLRVLALSLVTNSHAVSSQVEHQEVLDVAASVGDRLVAAIETIVQQIGAEARVRKVSA